MAMTPEQKAASEQVHEAILNLRRVCGYDDGFLVTDWMILIAETKFDENGDSLAAYTRLYREGEMPGYRSLGLLETHRALVTHDMLGNRAER